MSNLSRRSLVTRAAALPALAVPAVAIAASAEPDPIFAAIDRWNDALAVENESFRIRDNAQEAFMVRYGSLTPSGLPKEMGEVFEKAGDRNPYLSLSTHKQISALKSHADLGKYVPFFHRTLNIQTDDYEKNVARVEEVSEEASSNRFDAAYAIFDIVPTTVAGVRAKIDWAMSVDHVTGLLSDEGEDENGTLGNFLETLYESACLIART